MQNSSVIVDTCDKWGPGLWQWYCETIGIEYPKVSLWPSELQWYNLSAYRLDWRDVALITFCATILTVLRYRIQNVTLAQARRANMKDPRKYSESIWKTMFYVVSFLWGFYLIAKRNFVWVYSYDAAFLHVPELYLRPERTETDLYSFYIFGIGFYAHSIYAHVFIETKRNDFYQMLLHHVATLMLITLSFTTRFVAIGVVLVNLHDFSDILFEVAKIYVYKQNEFLANIWFSAWVLSWIVLRLMYFPYYVVKGSVYNSVHTLGQYPHYWTCSMMIVILQALHIFWFVLIMKMVVKLLTGTAEKVVDSRETDDDEGETIAHTDKPQSKKKR